MKKLLPVLFTAILCAANFNAISKLPATIPVAQDDRVVKNFNGIASGGPIDVVIKLGNTESLKFEGDAEAISTLVTEVKGGILIIRPKNSWKSWAKKYENKKITAYVSAKTVTSLTMSGNGSITVNGMVEADALATTLSGSGRIKANFSTGSLTSVISGSGNLDLTGKANDANVTISGSGSFNGKAVTANNLTTRISGSGTVNIRANQKIEAVISGSGHVNYSGNPSVKKTVIGSGDVNQM